MAATYSIIDIELRSDMAIQYTKGGRVPLVFRRPQRVHFRNANDEVYEERKRRVIGIGAVSGIGVGCIRATLGGLH